MAEFVIQAKKKGVPLLAVRTRDQQDACRSIANALDEANQDGQFQETRSLYVYQWDGIRGIQTLAAPKASSKSKTAVFDESFANGLKTLAFGCPDHVPHWGTMIMQNGAWLLQDKDCIQAIMNLRDIYESSFRTLILLGHEIDLPIELRQDVLVYEEPLPSHEDLKELVMGLYKDNELDVDDKDVSKSARTLGGLAKFPSKQAAAMALRKTGIDSDILWERKKSFIRAVEGLSLPDLTLDYSNVGGNEGIKQHIMALINGPANISKVVHIDEFDKIARGMRGENGNNAVDSDRLQLLLDWLNPKKKIVALLLAGVPGTGKTFIAETTGPQFKLPMFRVDMGAAKGHGLVGQAEHAIRGVIETIDSSTEGSALVLATCNDFDERTFPAELIDRFQDRFFFELPNQDEKDKIWPVYLKSFGLKDKDLPDDTEWSGRNIFSCCMQSWMTGKSIQEVSKCILPVVVTDPVRINAIRSGAHQKFRSASVPDSLYTMPKKNGVQEGAPTAAPKRTVMVK